MARWFRKTLSHPTWPLRAGGGLLRARFDLRHCQQVGARPRLYGRCLVSNGGVITIGDRLLMYGATVRCELTTHSGGRLEIGDRVFVNYGSSISAHTLVRIGNRCLIGQYSIIMDCDYHSPDDDDDHGESRPIVIEDGAWLGARDRLEGGHDRPRRGRGGRERGDEGCRAGRCRRRRSGEGDPAAALEPRGQRSGHRLWHGLAWTPEADPARRGD